MGNGSSSGDVEERALILLREANELHDRLFFAIQSFQVKHVTLLSAILTFIGVQVAVFGLLSSLHAKFPAYEHLVFSLSILASGAAAVLNFIIVWPTEYKDKSSLDEDIFDELRRADKLDLIGDLTTRSRKWYEYNYEKYDPRLDKVGYVFGLYGASLALFFLYVLLVIPV